MIRHAYIFQVEEFKKLSANAFRVYVTLCSYAAPDGTGAYPTNSTLTEWCVVSENTLIKCLKELEDTGFITREIIHELNGRRGTYRRFIVHRTLSIGDSSTEFGQCGQDSQDVQNFDGGVTNSLGGTRPQKLGGITNNLGPTHTQKLPPNPPPETCDTKKQYHKITIPKENIDDDRAHVRETTTTTSKLEPFEAEQPTEFAASQVANLRSYGWTQRRSVLLVSLPEPLRDRVVKVIGPAFVSEVEAAVCQDMLDAPGFVSKVLDVVQAQKNKPGGIQNPMGYFVATLKSTWKGGNYLVVAQREAEVKSTQDAKDAEISKAYADWQASVKYRMSVLPYDKTLTPKERRQKSVENTADQARLKEIYDRLNQE